MTKWTSVLIDCVSMLTEHKADSPVAAIWILRYAGSFIGGRRTVTLDTRNIWTLTLLHRIFAFLIRTTLDTLLENYKVHIFDKH